MKTSWWAHGNNWLCRKATEHFNAWLGTPAGKKWRARQNRGSPYAAGYSQPEWMADAREALGKNQEEHFKHIMLSNL